MPLPLPRAALLRIRPPAAPSLGSLLQTSAVPLHPSQAGTLPQGKWRYTPIPVHMPTAQVPRCSGQILWLALVSVSIGSLNSLLKRKRNQPGLGPCLLETDKELTGPTGVWRARASKKGSVSFLAQYPPDPGTKTCPARKEDRAREGGWTPSQEGPLPQAQGSGLPEENGLTALRASAELFSFLKWEDPRSTVP